MKTLTIMGLFAAVAALFFAAPHRAAHAAPDNVSISVDMRLTGQTSAEGTFTASGAFGDSGAAVETFQMADGGSSVQGSKTLRGSNGDIVISFSGSITPLEGGAKMQVAGTWQVTSGTGAYAGIVGGGQVNTTLDLAAGTLHADYTGDVSLAAASAPAGMPRTGAADNLAGWLVRLALAAVAAGLVLAARGRSGRRSALGN